MSAVPLNEAQATLIINMIDIGSARGAWRGNELAAIGQLHDYLKSHINAAPQKPVPVNVSKVPGADGEPSSS